MDKETGGFNFGQVAPLAAPILGGIYSLFSPSRDTLRREQLEDQQKFTNMQADANKEQASYTAGLQKEMWDYTNFENQVKHAQEAGLNPGLLYGKGGAGGQTGSANAGAVSGGQAPSSAATRQNEMGMGMMIAQMGNLVAQTEKTKAETENIKAGTEKTGIDTATGKLNLDTATKTQDSTITTIRENAYKAISDAAIAAQNQAITEETRDAQIAKIKTEAIGALIENKVKESGLNLNEARIKEIAANIEQRWKEQDISVENNKRMTEAMLWGAGIHAAGNLVGDIVGIAGKTVPNVTKHIK